MSEHFELLDIYKALGSIVAGLVLGLERELKDKSAGLKTITIICLGSALFSIISYKLAGHGDPTRIASYIVSGIGFLGAGVIFKSGFTVYGLTTAGIIWISAAIGMAIGFGEIYIALTFLVSALIVIYVGKLFTTYLITEYQNRVLNIKINSADFSQKKIIVAEITKMAKIVSETAVEKVDQNLSITMDLYINSKEIENLENYLIENKSLIYFSY